MFKTDNFFPVEAGGYANYIMNAGFGMGMYGVWNWFWYFLMIPVGFIWLGYYAIGTEVAGIYEDSSQTLFAEAVDYILVPAVWFPISLMILLVRLIEQGFYEIILLFVPDD